MITTAVRLISLEEFFVSFNTWCAAILKIILFTTGALIKTRFIQIFWFLLAVKKRPGVPFCNRIAVIKAYIDPIKDGDDVEN